MELAEYIAETNDCFSDNDLFEKLQAFVKPFGLDSLIFCLMTNHPSIGERAKHGKIVGYPQDWMKFYQEQNYELVDPIRKEVMKTQRVFTWREADKLQPFNRHERTMMSEAREAGLRDGIAVSLQNSYNEIVAFGFASQSGGVDVSPNLLSALKLASVQFYDVYQSLKRKNSEQPPRIYLTEREAEVLKWSAAGKSRSAISEILDISENTVNYHLKRCFTKLNANSNTLAVLKAVRLGLLDQSHTPNIHSY
ncbi:hypothetical protein GC177_06525 [bacterium]|nr:hypothetical protein [bacterium]